MAQVPSFRISVRRRFEDIVVHTENPFAGRLTVTPVEAAAAAINWEPSTTYSALSKGTFPFPTVEIAGRKLVRVSDLLVYIQNLPAVSHKQVRRVGKPKKAQQLARQKNAGEK